MKKILEIISVKFQFLVVKFSTYLNRRVFVMIWVIVPRYDHTFSLNNIITSIQSGTEANST